MPPNNPTRIYLHPLFNPNNLLPSSRVCSEPTKSITAWTPPLENSLTSSTTLVCVALKTAEAPSSFAKFSFCSSISITNGWMLNADFAIFKAKTPKPPAPMIAN